MFIFIDDFVDLLRKYEKSQATFGEYTKIIYCHNIHTGEYR